MHADQLGYVQLEQFRNKTFELERQLLDGFGFGDQTGYMVALRDPHARFTVPESLHFKLGCFHSG